MFHKVDCSYTVLYNSLGQGSIIIVAVDVIVIIIIIIIVIVISPCRTLGTKNKGVLEEMAQWIKCLLLNMSNRIHVKSGMVAPVCKSNVQMMS